MVGIYAIRNSINGKMYIGQSRDIMRRWEQHVYHRCATTASEIDKAINEFGLQNFDFIILDLCEPEELDMKEDYYIRYYKTWSNGYNRIFGGQDNLVVRIILEKVILMQNCQLKMYITLEKCIKCI